MDFPPPVWGCRPCAASLSGHGGSTTAWTWQANQLFFASCPGQAAFSMKNPSAPVKTIRSSPISLRPGFPREAHPPAPRRAPPDPRRRRTRPASARPLRFPSIIRRKNLTTGGDNVQIQHVEQRHANWQISGHVPGEEQRIARAAHQIQRYQKRLGIHTGSSFLNLHGQTKHALRNHGSSVNKNVDSSMR